MDNRLEHLYMRVCSAALAACFSESVDLSDKLHILYDALHKVAIYKSRVNRKKKV